MDDFMTLLGLINLFLKLHIYKLFFKFSGQRGHTCTTLQNVIFYALIMVVAFVQNINSSINVKLYLLCEIIIFPRYYLQYLIMNYDIRIKYYTLSIVNTLFKKSNLNLTKSTHVVEMNDAMAYKCLVIFKPDGQGLYGSME